MNRRGKYIVIEGHDGTGKSLQIERLQKKLRRMNIESIQVHEPDGAPMASKLRDLIKDGTLKREPWTNVMLFTVARRASWFQQMKPALEAGTFVLAARNWLSTIVYQGYGQGMPIEMIRRFTEDNVAGAYLKPDLSLILTLESEAIRSHRIDQRGELEKPDTFESMSDDFQGRVKKGYVRYAELQSIPLIDASGSPDEVEKLVWQQVELKLDLTS